jgi:DNA invertase Pin-like site-specific DNA recombinase
MDFYTEYSMSQKIALYIRTSTDNQKESLILQNDELRKYCEIKEYEIVDVYQDDGWSGKNAIRPAFERMMKDAEAGKYEILLVTKIDRFARSIVDCLVNIEKLQRFGVQFTATSQTINTGDAMGRLTLHIMAAFAEFEREIIKERMSAGRKAAIANGKECYRHKKDIKKKEVLGYLDKNLSATAIAKILGVDTTTVTNRLEEWNFYFDHERNKWVEATIEKVNYDE